VATFDGPARAVRCACAIRDRLQASEIEILRESIPARSSCSVTTWRDRGAHRSTGVIVGRSERGSCLRQSWTSSPDRASS
jgi:hypothetical protein